MNRHVRMVVLGTVLMGSAVGCQSNPYRPTLFHRNRDSAVGPELSGPPMVQEGPFLGSEANGGYPGAPNTVPPGNYFPPPGTVPPQGMPSPPVQGFPQTMPPAPNQLPQGPPPKTTTPNTNGAPR